jgi:UDP-N-acetylglucosamine 4-epimerase
MEIIPDFTYIDNVIQMNALAMLTQNPQANTVYNTAYGDRNTLNNLVGYLKDLAAYDERIGSVPIVYGPKRAGISHSLSIDKAKMLLDYDPKYSMQKD